MKTTMTTTQVKAAATAALLTLGALAMAVEPIGTATTGEWIEVMYWSKAVAVLCVASVWLLWRKERP